MDKRKGSPLIQRLTYEPAAYSALTSILARDASELGGYHFKKTLMANAYFLVV